MKGKAGRPGWKAAATRLPLQGKTGTRGWKAKLDGCGYKARLEGKAGRQGLKVSLERKVAGTRQDWKANN